MFTLEQWRLVRKVKQAEIAEQLGISTMTYMRWEKEPEKIPYGKVLEIAKILQVNITDIIFLPKEATECSTEE